MHYTMTIAGLERTLKIFPVDDELSIAALNLFGDVELAEAAGKALIAAAPAFDVILTPEAKSISLAHEMAKAAGMNDYVVARKRKKVYMGKVVSSKTKSITTAGEQELFLGEDDVAKLRGKRVLIVDDVVSTGGSLKSLEALVAASEGSVAGKAFVLAEGAAVKRDDIIFLEPLPLFDAEGQPLPL